MSDISINDQIIKRLYEDATFSLGWVDKVKDALKFMEEYDTDLAIAMEIGKSELKKEYQDKVNKCIDKLDKLIEETYYKSVDGSLMYGAKNSAYHHCKEIIQQGMGCENEIHS